MPVGTQLSIGEVLACLQPEFPGVTISKIRFLEAEGLVEPSRTAAGYRKFSPGDVERLRYVLTVQRDQYLPLRVIKDQLEARDAARSGPANGATAETGRVRHTRSELLERTGCDPATLDALEASGLLPRRRGYPEKYYDADDLAVAHAVVAITRFGLEPRHLRAFKGAADREAGLIQQCVAPVARARTAGERERARQATHELAACLVRLHSALLTAGLRDHLEP